MTAASEPLPAASVRSGLGYQARVVRVLAQADFKAKYAGAALGYAWSIAKPLALFGILYVVFGLGLKLADTIPHYPIYLILGIVLFIFFADATTAAMTSLVARQTLLRRLVFPRLVIPVATTVAVGLTFVVNVLAASAFVAGSRITPGLDWLLLVPLLAELYLFVLGISLLLAAVYVRFRDVHQLWELALRVLFYATPIIYPLQLLPQWAERVVLLNPFAQIMQDVRAVVIGDGAVTVTEAFGHDAALLGPLAIVALVLALGLTVFKHEEPRFAERV